MNYIWWYLFWTFDFPKFKVRWNYTGEFENTWYHERLIISVVGADKPFWLIFKIFRLVSLADVFSYTVSVYVTSGGPYMKPRIIFLFFKNNRIVQWYFLHTYIKKNRQAHTHTHTYTNVIVDSLPWYLT